MAFPTTGFLVARNAMVLVVCQKGNAVICVLYMLVTCLVVGLLCNHSFKLLVLPKHRPEVPQYCFISENMNMFTKRPVVNSIAVVNSLALVIQDFASNKLRDRIEDIADFV